MGRKDAVSGLSALAAALEKGLGHGQAAEHPSPERLWASLCRGEEGFEQSAPLVLHIRDDSLDHTAVPPPSQESSCHPSLPGEELSPLSASKGGQGGHRANGRDRDGNNRR